MTARLIYADSERSADLYYATRFFAPDAFLFVQDEAGARHLVTSALEIDRARRTARVDVVHDWQDVRKRLPEVLQGEGGHALILGFLRERGIDRVEVPEDFPLGVADRLRRGGVEVVPVLGSFWPGRVYKDADEVAALVEALRITGQGMAAGIELIRASVPGEDGLLHLDGGVLTSERVREAIHVALVRHGAMPAHTIVSGGLQGSDPHEVGHGSLPAHQAIILDIFPRVVATGYWGDMTRTVCRGRASERLRRAWEAVRQAQEVGFARVRHGVSGLVVHREVTDCLTCAGFPTGVLADGRQGGFFHGTGHGLGLEIHEVPRIGSKDYVLEAGHVVTVEPGVYYPDMGGVRLEDVVLVTEGGCRNLTDFPKYFEI